MKVLRANEIQDQVQAAIDSGTAQLRTTESGFGTTLHFRGKLTSFRPGKMIMTEVESSRMVAVGKEPTWNKEEGEAMVSTDPQAFFTQRDSALRFEFSIPHMGGGVILLDE